MALSLDAFHAPLSDEAPPSDLLGPLAALWWAYRGRDGWHRAHVLVQDDDGVEAAWIHAHLHRAEGDAGNAAYWYARAGKPPADTPLADERETIARALLANG